MLQEVCVFFPPSSRQQRTQGVLSRSQVTRLRPTPKGHILSSTSLLPKSHPLLQESITDTTQSRILRLKNVLGLG